MIQVARSGRTLGEAERELATARSRAEAAVKAADLAEGSAQQSVGKLEEEVRQSAAGGGVPGRGRVARVGVGHRTSGALPYPPPAGGPPYLFPLLSPLLKPPLGLRCLQVHQLREALSAAQQRATAGEAKVELLQEAVRKAEERAARLEMEASAAQRSGMAAGGACPAGPPPATRAELAGPGCEEVACTRMGWFFRAATGLC